MNDVQDQNYTIAKIIGEPKVYGDKTRFAFTCNETGETIHSLFTKFPDGIKAGAEIWGHLEAQEKDGKTYSNFFFGKNNPNKKGGMSEADKAQIVFANRTANAALAEVKKLRGELELAGVLPTVASGGETADFGEGSSFPGQKDPEEESLEASAEAAMVKF